MLNPNLCGPHHGKGRRVQAGMSIVELMVGVAVGLIVVAAASLLMTSQLVENRRLLMETQLQQDLRAAADIMTRDLRRAGSQPELGALGLIWYPGATGTSSNIRARNFSAGSTTINFEYEPGGTTAIRFGYELLDGVIRARMGASGGFQELTDKRVMVVDSLTFDARNASATPVRLPCSKPCPDTTNNCWPTYEVREVDLVITAHAKRDASVRRTVRSTVRLRNDHVVFFNPASSQACPS
jgi:type II secretory pathway pseudopilin PulG